MKSSGTPCIIRVLFCLVWVISSCSRSPKADLERANQLYTLGKFEDASLVYRKAIQKDPTLGDSYYRLGLSELARHNVKDAHAAFSRAAVLLPTRTDVKAALADLYIKSYEADPRHPEGAYKEAVRLTSEIEAQAPGSYDALRFRGYLALIDRQFAAGIEKLQKANQLKPFQSDVVFPLADALIHENQLPAAEDLALKMIAHQKDYIPIYDLLYRAYLGAKREADAESLLKTKIANNPERPELQLQLAIHYARFNRTAEKQAVLQRIMGQPRGYLSAGNFHAAVGNWDEALRLFDEGARKFPDDKVAYLKRKMIVLLAQKKTQDARQVVDMVLAAAPKDEESLRLRATLMLDDGLPQNIDKAMSELVALVKQSPDDLAARMTLALAYQRGGKTAEAKSQLLECVQRSPVMLPAHMLLAELAVQERKPVEVLERVGAILALQPGNPRARLLRATANMTSFHYPEARKDLSSLLEDHPRYADAELLLGRLDLVEKKYDRAEAIFRKHYREGQPDLRPLQGLVDVMLVRRQPDRALKVLQAELTKSKQPTPVRSMLATVAAQSGRNDLALEQLQRLSDENPKSAAWQIRIGEMYVRKDDFTKATPYFAKALELAPDDPNAQFLMAYSQDRTGKKSEAIAGYRRVIERQSENAVALNNLAFLLADTGGSLDEALKFAQRAQAKMRSQSLNDTLGWIYLKQNLADSALQIFSELVKTNPANPTYRHHLGLALLAKGDKIKARMELNAALSQKPQAEEDAKVRQALARIN